MESVVIRLSWSALKVGLTCLLGGAAARIGWHYADRLIENSSEIADGAAAMADGVGKAAVDRMRPTDADGVIPNGAEPRPVADADAESLH
jgi:hypothetical protein